MRIWITRDWDDKTYEVWSTKPCNWNEGVYEGDIHTDIIQSCIKPTEAKKLFNLPRHLKKREVVEGTMTFKVRVK